MSNDRADYRGNPLDLIGTLADVAGGLGNWIANGTPESGSIAGEIQQRYRDHCDAWSNAPTWAQQLDPGARLFLSNACAAWLDSQGSGDPVLETPFTGGQCGVEYEMRLEISGTVERCSGGNPSPSGRSANSRITPIGPISEPFVKVEADGQCGPIQVRACVNAFDDNGDPVEVCSQTISAGRSDWRLVDISATVIEGPTRLDGQPDDCGNLQGEPGPNPNPRPDPGLDPEDEPFEREPGQPVFPMPRITDPFGEPVQLPNLPGLPISGTEDEEGSTNPNVGPPITPGDPQDGNGTDGEDDDFGEPPEGHIWVGFVVELSDQGVSEGLQPNSPPEPIYRATTGNYRAKYDVEGEIVYSSPREIRQRMSTYFLDLAGLTLTGARVNVPSNDSYIVTPLSQPVTEEEEPQQV